MVHVFCNLEEEQDGQLPLCDMTFEIVEQQFDTTTSCWRLALHADATPYEPVGFSVSIPTCGWQAQVSGEGDNAFHSYWGAVSLHSRGVESDRLLVLMADYYGVPIRSGRKKGLLSNIFRHKDTSPTSKLVFADKIQCIAVGIESDPAIISDHPVHLKLFFGDGDEGEPYAEVFLDIDLLGGFAAMNEKDEEYRADLIHWLAAPGVDHATSHNV